MRYSVRAGKAKKPEAAHEENQRARIVQIVGGVAQAYFDLRQFDMQLNIAKRTLQAWEESVSIAQARHESGSALPIDAAEVSMKHVNVVTNGINHEAGAMALNGVMSAVPGTKMLEEGIRQDKKGVLRISDAVPQLIYVHGLDGKIIFVNKFAADYCGLTLENIQTDDFLPRLFHPDDAERVREVPGNAREPVAPFELKLRLRRHDGQYRWFSLFYDPLLDVQKHVGQWYVRGTPIEERKQSIGGVEKVQLAFHIKLVSGNVTMAVWIIVPVIAC